MKSSSQINQKSVGNNPKEEIRSYPSAFEASPLREWKFERKNLIYTYENSSSEVAERLSVIQSMRPNVRDVRYSYTYQDEADNNYNKTI